MPPTIALVTCRELPGLEDDDRLLLAPLRERGIEAVPAVWDDPAVNWSGFDLAVLRSPWDYADRRDEFLAWAAGVPRLANPYAVVRWNTDKRYLADLADAGLPVVATTWLAPGGSAWIVPTEGEYVIKPAISVGSRDTGRYDLADPVHHERAAAHVERLRGAGRLVMVQPYLPAVDTAGETAMIYFGGRFSHAIRKGPMLSGPDEGVTGLYKPEQITAREGLPSERAVAERVLTALPRAGRLVDLAAPSELLYARIDLIPDPDGEPVVVELELTEPSVFLGYAEGAAHRFANAIARRLTR